MSTQKETECKINSNDKKEEKKSACTCHGTIERVEEGDSQKYQLQDHICDQCEREATTFVETATNDYGLKVFDGPVCLSNGKWLCAWCWAELKCKTEGCNKLAVPETEVKAPATSASSSSSDSARKPKRKADVDDSRLTDGDIARVREICGDARPCDECMFEGQYLHHQCAEPGCHVLLCFDCPDRCKKHRAEEPATKRGKVDPDSAEDDATLT